MSGLQVEIGLFVLVGLGVAWWILRVPYMRSARVVLLVLGCTALSVLIAILAPSWSVRSPATVLPTVAFGLVAFALVVMPVFVVRPLEASLSALSPTDFRELEVLRSARVGLSGIPTETQERLTLDILDRSTPVAPEWAAARAVLKEQIRESLAKREGDEAWQPDEVTDFGERFSRAWRYAIERRARFFR